MRLKTWLVRVPIAICDSQDEVFCLCVHIEAEREREGNIEKEREREREGGTETEIERESERGRGIERASYMSESLLCHSRFLETKPGRMHI